MARYRTSKMADLGKLPWQTILIFTVVIGYIVYKLMNTPTMLGDLLKKIFNPDKASIVEHKEQAFDNVSTGNLTWTVERIRSDAKEVARCLGTGLYDNWFSHFALPSTKEKAYKIICNYTNPVYTKRFKDAYANIYTNHNDLGSDVHSYLSRYVADLQKKGII